MSEKMSVRPMFRGLAALVALLSIWVAASAAQDAIGGRHPRWLVAVLGLAFFLEFASVAIRGTGLLVLTGKRSGKSGKDNEDT